MDKRFISSLIGAHVADGILQDFEAGRVGDTQEEIRKRIIERREIAKDEIRSDLKMFGVFVTDEDLFDGMVSAFEVAVAMCSDFDDLGLLDEMTYSITKAVAPKCLKDEGRSGH